MYKIVEILGNDESEIIIRNYLSFKNYISSDYKQLIVNQLLYGPFMNVIALTNDINSPKIDYISSFDLNTMKSSEDEEITSLILWKDKIDTTNFEGSLVFLNCFDNIIETSGSTLCNSHQHSILLLNESDYIYVKHKGIKCKISPL